MDYFVILWPGYKTLRPYSDIDTIDIVTYCRLYIRFKKEFSQQNNRARSQINIVFKFSALTFVYDWHKNNKKNVQELINHLFDIPEKSKKLKIK